MSDRIDASLSASPQADESGQAFARALLQRRVRPGLVDVAHARGLTVRKFPAASDSVLLRRLLARRGADDTVIASGTLLLAQPLLAEVAPEAMPEASREPAHATVVQAMPVASAAMSPNTLLASSLSNSSDRPSAERASLKTRASVTTGSGPSPDLVLRSARGVVVDRGIDLGTGADSVPAVTAPRIAAGNPIPFAAAELVGLDAPRSGVTERPVDEGRILATVAQARPRELPGPAVGADLLLPPNPPSPDARRSASTRRTRTEYIEVNGEPVDQDLLILVQAATPAAGASAPEWASAVFPASAPAIVGARSASARSQAVAAPAAIPAPIDSPPVAETMALPSGSAEARQLAESVGRELVRSMRRARERKGLPSWKN